MIRKNRFKLLSVMLILVGVGLWLSFPYIVNAEGERDEVDDDIIEEVIISEDENPGGNAIPSDPDGQWNWRRKATTDWTWNQAKRGSYWIYVATDSDDVDLSTLGFHMLRSSGHMTGCGKAGGFYILVTQLYYKKQPTDHLVGKIPMNEVYGNGGKIREDVAGLPGGPGTPVPESVASQAFSEYRDFYIQNFGLDYNPTSSLSAFCAVSDVTVRKIVKKYSPKFTCFDERENGDTQTRIGIVNWSLDSNNIVSADNKDNTYENLSLKNTSPRAELHTDSMSTEGADDVEMIARPGDSIQFLHEVCMGARRTREVYSKQQNYEWTYASHNRVNKMRGLDQTFEITANNELYLFGNNIEPVNSHGPVTNYGTVSGVYDDGSSLGKKADKIFKIASNKAAGLVVRPDYDQDALGLVSPSLDNNSYICDIDVYNGASYESGTSVGGANQFIEGSFQIPGFIKRSDAQKCEAANLTKVTNQVGKTIVQKHKYTFVSLFEKYATTLTGQCGCDDPSARQGDNITRSSVFSAKGNWWGRRDPNRPYKCDAGKSYDFDCACVSHHTDWTWHYPGPGDDWNAYQTGDTVCDQWNGKLLFNYKYGGKTASVYEYSSIMEGPEDREKSATVYIPYNFQTSVTSSINGGEGAVLFQGGIVKPSFTWSVEARDNDKMGKSVGTSFAYATPTPEGDGTELLAVEFILPVETTDVKLGDVKAIRDPGHTANENSICGYFGGSNCNLIERQTGALNQPGNYGGETGGLGAYNRVVPDNGDYVGKKYCVALALYPSDSHDYVGENTIDQQKSEDFGGAMDAGEYWNISNASCRTIAKKPNFQVWNGSVYTKGSIYTSITRKDVGAGGGNYNIDSTTLFGSWSEYGIIAGKNAYSTGSGAVLGYNNKNDNSTLHNFSLPGGAGEGTTYQKLGKQTISNNDVPGKSGVDVSQSIGVNLARLKARYQEKVTNMPSKKEKQIVTTKTGLQYVYSSGNMSIRDVVIDATTRNNNLYAYNTIRNGNGLAKSVCKGLNNGPCESVDNTLVIVVDGTLTIDKNICLSENPNNCSGDAHITDATRLYTYRDIKTTAPSSLPQILIFAKNIDIDQSVTRIDAWLIAPEGNIDTCKNFVTPSDTTYGTNTDGCNKTLVINGPVYSNHMYLFRTAGSHYGVGDEGLKDAGGDILKRSLGDIGVYSEDVRKGSIAPAEIFNLRADVYIWAYNQAQRYSEAVVTYTRELAPRY